MKHRFIITMALAGLHCSLAAGAAEKPSVAVLWLAPPADKELLVKASQAIDGNLATSERVRPLTDATVKQALIDGGPNSKVNARLALARSDLAAGKLAQAAKVASEAETMALSELANSEIRPLLSEIESLRLLLADMARDDVAALRAARLLQLSDVKANAELKTALERYRFPFGPSLAASAVRVESEPSGAEVFVDLRSIGKTPIDLPVARAPEAMIDIELQGYLKVHRLAPGAGTLAIVLTPDTRVGPFVDQLRAQARGTAEPPEAAVTALGRRLGVERMLVVRPLEGIKPALEARVLDVGQGKWAKPAVTLPLEGDEIKIGARLAAYAGPDLAAQAALPTGASPTAAVDSAKAASATTAATATAAAKPAKEKGTFLGKKWYTWLIGGALVAVVIGLVVAQQVGSDSMSVNVTH